MKSLLKPRKKRLGLKEILEISKPRIVVLLVITAVTSMYAASKLIGPELDYLDLLHIIVAGALASAGSSALNHYYDKDIDPMMKRTSTRPIPSGRLKAQHAMIYGLAVSAASVIYAAFTLNLVSTFFIALGIFFYVVVYTIWLKRLNSSNIVIGGFAGSAASMAGWAAATGSMDLLGFLVGFLVFVWTPSHFWCLAMKIKDDYAEAKIPMLPVLVGMQKTSNYILINTAILLPYSLALYAFGLGLVYLVIAAIS
ncbi:MAG: protoheme IX farnesyltransferase, partial [Nitrosopumilales archaeon]|nr:protoheme IX farnesyltransferase [Nitrosopumilales archaeon]